MPYVDLESVNKNTVVSELKSVIGKDVSQNQSPTCRGKLIKVGKAYSTFESVPSPYAKFTNPEDVGVKYKVPNQFAWNSFFY
jgi:hypothetical protein